MKKKVLCFGELLIRLGAPGRELLLQSRTLEVHYAGAEANVAVSLSHFGHATAVASVVPDNALGHASIGELRRHGVNADHVLTREGRMGLYFLTTGAMQRPSDVLYDRADSAFATAPDDLFDWPAMLRDVSWLHISGITPAVSDASAQMALTAARTAVEKDVAVSFDCNFRPRVWGSRSPQAPAILKEFCSYATLIFGEDRDFELILGRDDGSATARAFAAFPRLHWVANTQRARESVDSQQISARLRSRDKEWTTGPFELSGIVDRIGAGDAFAAGILHGLINDQEPQRVIDFALAACRYKHSVPGDYDIASTAEIDAVLSTTISDVRR